MLTNRDYDLISEYLDNALSGDERAEVERRVASDPEFAAELEAIRRTVALIKTLPTLVAPRDFRLTREQADQIDRERRPVVASRRTAPLSRWVIPALSAVASTLLVVMGMVMLLGAPRVLNPQPASVAMLAVTEGSGDGETPVFEAFESANSADVETVPPLADLKTSQPDVSGGADTTDSLPAVGQDVMALMAAPEDASVPTEEQPEDSTAAEMSMRSALAETTLTLESPGGVSDALPPLPLPTRAALATPTLSVAQPTQPVSDSSAPILSPLSPEMVTENADVAELDVQAGPPDATLSADTLPDDTPVPLVGLLMVVAGLGLGALTLTMALRRRG